MSGTSADGIDVAVIDLEGGHDVRLRAFHTYPIEEAVRSELFDLFAGRGHVRDAWRMHVLVAEMFAQAAIMASQGDVDLIASHGQTVYHQPQAEPFLGFSIRCTTQIGDGCVLAARTGRPVVSDFRVADLALGGQGAPLVPYADSLLFRDASRYRVALNVGGIANLTWLPPHGAGEGVRAFDTGPGNALMDAMVRLRTGSGYDEGGALAAQGRVDATLLARLLAHPYFQQTGARSTGREAFGEDLVRQAVAADAPLPDVLATLCTFTAQTIVRGIEELPRVDEVYVAGGGSHNHTLMAALGDALGPVPLRPLADLGIPVDAREAIAFALMGDATMRGLPSNVPTATGARGPAILGKISLPYLP